MGNKKLTIVTLLIFTIFLNLNATQSSYNSTTAESRVINVTIDNFFFSLSSSEININENITFNVTNNGGSRHTFTLLDSSFGIDITLNSGENELISFIAPATLQSLGYQCKFHPSSMSGIINVIDPDNYRFFIY